MCISLNFRVGLCLKLIFSIPPKDEDNKETLGGNPVRWVYLLVDLDKYSYFPLISLFMPQGKTLNTTVRGSWGRATNSLQSGSPQYIVEATDFQKPPPQTLIHYTYVG